MRHRNDGAVAEPLANDPLHELVSLHIHARTDFIQHHNLAPTHHRPGQAEKLPLAVAQEVGRHHGVEPAFLLDDGPDLTLGQRGYENCVAFAASQGIVGVRIRGRPWIHVEPHRLGGHPPRFLRDHIELCTECLAWNTRDVDPVDLNPSAAKLKEMEETGQH
ncbi:uncharacterized protein PV07_07970 [Cladophialophora immunda]|uniref:Uncharacterized protein n=1 Tax=Cladophialophora immunda TaxID=569365 RepID=A0A0D2CXD9_9EURO|nr:uncharacterized protein PV07_07970 [Cladophialophora immunda]KIW28294.1 hypothetical protein PV07_07970 [Cladophialophora immunda]